MVHTREMRTSHKMSKTLVWVIMMDCKYSMKNKPFSKHQYKIIDPNVRPTGTCLVY